MEDADPRVDVVRVARDETVAVSVLEGETEPDEDEADAHDREGARRREHGVCDELEERAF